MKLSIVIPYYNRKQLLINTLRSIDYFSKDRNIELIVVDDGSNMQNQITDLKLENLDITIFRLERSSMWRGACMAYNTGFKEATGDYILINSSECIHTGDIIGYLFEFLEPDKYINFSAYMGRPSYSFDKLDWHAPDLTERIFKVIEPLNHWWGVHSRVGNFIPYCGAISKDNMDKLGGYDERFVKGIGYDDYDFTHRVKNLKLKMIAVDDPFVVHQYHELTNYTNNINLDFLKFLNKNFPDRIKAEKNTLYVAS